MTSKAENKYLAVYGTLRSDHANNMGGGPRALIKNSGKRVGLGVLLGYLMYNLGAYPAIVETDDEDEPEVTVEVWEIDGEKWDTVIAALNRYEGGGYRLIPDTVVLREGNTVQAFFYRWALGAIIGGELIRSGDWMDR